MLGLGVGAATGYGVSRVFKKQQATTETPLPELTDGDAAATPSNVQSPTKPEKGAETDAPKPVEKGAHELPFWNNNLLSDAQQ